MKDFKNISHISGGYTGGTGHYVSDKEYYVGYLDNKVSYVEKDLKDMSLIEAKDYYTRKLEETYKLEERYAQQLKVITLMLHTDKSDD